MNQFTKGPWKYEFDNADFSGGGQWYSVMDENETNLLWFPYNSPKSVGDEKLANAKLMAAAPDLYEALREMDAMFSAMDGSNNWYRRSRLAVVAARAALEKVTA